MVTERRMQRRRLIVTLPGEAYRPLEQLAEREERPTERQATLLLQRAIAGAADGMLQAGQESPRVSG
jgi:hypothetical protein